MRRTLASPNLAISSNRPATMRGDVLSASISTAKRRSRLSSAMRAPRRKNQAEKLGGRFLEECADVDVGAIDQRERRLFSGECQEETGAAQHDGLDAALHQRIARL